MRNRPNRRVWICSLILFLSFECSNSFGTSPTDTTSTASEKLLALTKERFHDLSAAERKLVEAAADGTVADCWPLSGEDRVIRAELLAWLCIDPHVSNLVTSRGISISGTTIRGLLDLGRANISFPLGIESSIFNDSVNLHSVNLLDAHLVYLSMRGSQVKGLSLGGAQIDRSVYLDSGFESTGTVDLVGAKIGGNLSCTDGRFAASGDSAALDASGATIGSNLDCTGGTFAGAGTQPALSANRADIKGAVFMKEGFTARGEVNLVGATIDSNLDCTGGKFVASENSWALEASGAKIQGYVLLNGDPDAGNVFSAEGGVRFTSAAIGGDLYCDHCYLAGGRQNGTALLADGAKIDGSVDFLSEASIDGDLDFRYTTIARDFKWATPKFRTNARLDARQTKVGSVVMDLKKAPSSGYLYIDGFVYDHIDDLTSANSANPLRWISRQKHDRFLPQPYEQLSFVLRRMGFQEDAVKVLVTKNENAGYFALKEVPKATHKHLTKKRYLQVLADLLTGVWDIFWYRVFGKFIGYGYTPSNALYASLVIVGVGYFVFKKGYATHIIIPKEDGVSRLRLEQTYPKFNAWIYSLETFVPLVKLGLSDSWIPNAHAGTLLGIGKFPLLRTGSLLRHYFWFHIMAGWVLTTLWVASFTGLIKS